MPNELPQIRANLTRIGSTLKQGNLLSAAQAMRKGVHTLQSKNLMRAEIDELRTLIKQGSDYLSHSLEIKSIFPLALEYTKGEEESYLATLDELIDCLQSETSQAGILLAEEMSRKKTEGLNKGRAEVQEGRYEDANSTFTALTNEFPQDALLINDIAQVFMEANLNDEAASYLQEALRVSPQNVHTLNKLAVTLRKIKLFEESEHYFQKAMALDDSDPYLCFNYGRLYLDWQKYDKGLQLAERACSLQPSFEEARKMRSYFKKKLAK